MSDLDQCIHLLPLDWCAICLKQDSATEEQKKLDTEILKNLGSWNE